ncbi:acyl-coenzyme A thioesterase 13-like [Trifolium pratense]|uniref:acyl-coenzyme A thioesterase 13-like n=1 Tax=Trifolium pratense TaxID=57577 RepID=UPI001E691E41|nr:acyl-coenzyme A thioesterase 13-like [Trifolium pratense]
MGKIEFESVKRYLVKNKGESESESTVDDEELPRGFLDHLILRGLCLHLIEPGRVLFSMNIPPRLLNSGNYLHGGVITTLVNVVGAAAIPAAGFPWETGVSLEINVSCLDATYAHEEIEIDARVLRVGKTIAAVSVEFRKKKTGQIIAQGRHTKYLPRTSKL